MFWSRTSRAAQTEKPLTATEALVVALTEKTRSGGITWIRKPMGIHILRFECTFGGVTVASSHYRGAVSRPVEIGWQSVEVALHIGHNLFSAIINAEDAAKKIKLIPQMNTIWSHITGNVTEDSNANSGRSESEADSCAGSVLRRSTHHVRRRVRRG